MKRLARNLIVLSAILLLNWSSFAQGTRTWEQSKFEDLVKGTTDGVAIRSDGGLELAPAFKAIMTMPSPYVWAIATDGAGILYAATGTPARVYRITPDGKSVAIFQSQELQVQALAVDDNGAIYAATNPDGKVYLIHPAASTDTHAKGRKPKQAESDSNWNASVFFDPGTKYIWDLAIDKTGNLFVATGDHGEIFRMTPKGEHAVFFKSDEAHIRVLAFDRQGNLIAGSDGSGLIYRIAPNGDGFVLYSAPKKEITALAVDNDGNIYAAAAGEKRNAPVDLPNLFISPPSSSTSTPSSNGSSMGLSMGNAPHSSISQASLGSSSSSESGGSEIYRITPDGAPTRVWASSDDLVYALAFGPGGELLAGTGNRGHIFQVGVENNFTDLLKASANQVTAFARAANNALYVCTSNLGKIFLLTSSPNGEGTYVSDVFDAHIFSKWGRAEFRGDGNVELFARSGNVDNPDRNWSPWKKIDWRQEGEISAPPARFIQWKALLHAGNPPPRVESVTINYLSKNVAPEFDDVVIQEGVRYQPGARSGDNAGASADSQHNDNQPSPTPDREFIGVKWSVHDDNNDDMVYSIYYRSEGERRWLLLKNDLADKFYSFNSSLLPDGAYIIKIVASDAPSHSPGQGLDAERQSARFEIDTTPPRIEGLRGSIASGQLRIAFRAVDDFSPIQKAEYAIDAGNWQLVDPVGQISDSNTENYDFSADLLPPSTSGTTKGASATEHVVVVRAFDRHDNMASAKIVIGGK